MGTFDPIYKPPTEQGLPNGYSIYSGPRYNIFINIFLWIDRLAELAKHYSEMPVQEKWTIYLQGEVVIWYIRELTIIDRDLILIIFVIYIYKVLITHFATHPKLALKELNSIIFIIENL